MNQRKDSTSASCPTRPTEPPALLSIITPVHNGIAWLPRFFASLNCIASENRSQIQLVVIDDGSTDATAAWLAQQVVRCPNWRILLLSQSRSGPAAARNLGLDHAVGTWIMFLDHDDELAADPIPLLRRQEEGTSAILLPVRYVREERTVRLRGAAKLTARNHLDRLTAGNPLPICGILFRRQAMEQRMDPAVRFGEDWLFWACNPGLFAQPAVCLQPVLATVHLHAGNASGNYAAAGAGRELVADLLLARFGDRLSPKQRRNLAIQQVIGRIQQGQPAAWSALLRLPCDSCLYAKLWIYTLARLFGQRASLYQPRD